MTILSTEERGVFTATIDGFRIGDLLGRGGMGEVYRAWDERLERPVAIKLVRPEALESATMRSRFLREARTVAQLSHGAIVRIYQIVETEEQDFIVMEYLEGETLRALLRQGPLPLERALPMVGAIAEGLSEAHGKGIVHRDLKAENIIVTSEDQPKILDFGLAKSVHKSTALSAEGAVLGTLHCMSPEQAQGREVDHRSDLFSLGVLLYQTLTSRKPFRGSTVGEILAKVCVHRQEPVRKLNPEIPRALSNLVDDLLEKDPARRFGGAEEVADALAKLAAGLDSDAGRSRTSWPGTSRSRISRPRTSRSRMSPSVSAEGLSHPTLDPASRIQTLRWDRRPAGGPRLDEPQAPPRARQQSDTSLWQELPDKAPILYVDDEESNLMLFEQIFAEEYAIQTARSAQEAIEILRRQEIHLVITDQRMPGMTGVQLLEVIQSEFPDTVRMILTGYGQVDAVIQAINMGRVYQYVTKPWEEKELKVIIDRALESFVLQSRNRELLDELRQKVAREKEIRRAFQRYVPPTVVDSVLEDKSVDRLLGDSRIVVALYSHIHDFSRLSARLAPARVVTFLNSYLSRMHTIVDLHRGMVRDSNLSVFGAPVSALNNAENAVLAALEMRHALEEFNRHEAVELVGERLSIGLGINLGEVVVGNIGSEEKMEYSVVGEAVNTAARLSELTTDRPNSIVISQGVYARVCDLVEVEPLEPAVLRGRTEPTELYQVLGRKGSQEAEA